ncbi:SubName: Full=Related to WD-repeat protein, putative-Talaromyces stipitatus {ECO:0000313/EMBL:CCA73413.1} [Serendipita indica DSM 11827]|nr:SubName: Full=Related to WD-repeat protein, putative-Talaromyces stipitatus {ECO:0000313/EMBL:CCA73413.1} [Serendipita indica DSM 11827]
MKHLIKKIRRNAKSVGSSRTREPSPTTTEPALETQAGGMSDQEPPTSTVPPESDQEAPIRGIEELPNSPMTYEQVSEWLEQGSSVVRDPSETTPTLPSLNDTFSVVIRGIKLARAVYSNDEEWGQLLNDAHVHAHDIQSRIDKLASQQGPTQDGILDKAMESYIGVIREIVAVAKDAMTQAGGRQSSARYFAKITVSPLQIHLLRSKEEAAFRMYMGALSRPMVTKIDELADIAGRMRQDIVQIDPITIALGKGEEHEALGYALQYAYGTDLERCEPGTRIEVLSRIRQWGKDIKSEPMFWLRDAAGTGKSTIAVTIAAEWEREGRLAGRFFFSPNIALNKRIKYFCRTVAADIACHFPDLKEQIETKLKESPSMESRMDFALQFRQTIIEPLARRKTKETAILVIDALDNCDLDDRAYFLKTILFQLPMVPRLRILITSREIQDIVDVMNSSSLVCGQGIQLLNVNNPPQDDIAMYVHSKLHNYSLEDRQLVIDHAKGLFIWAATFCRTLLQTRLGARLLANLSHEAVTGSIDQLYLNVLKQALIDDGAGKASLRQVIQVIISAFQPVSTNTIISLLPAVHQIDELVQNLASVIKDGDPDRPLKVLHPTFREFIASNENRANGFLIHIDPSHSLVGQACLDVLEDSLRFDMLDLSREVKHLIPRNSDIKELEERIQKCTSPVVRYASSYWAHHVVASEDSWQDWAKIARFFQSHLYHWIEFMSWRGMLGYCLQALSRLSYRVRQEASITGSKVVIDKLFVQHAYLLVLRNHSLIQEAAFHTYTIPAALAPQGSPLSNVVGATSGFPLLKTITAAPVFWETQRRLSWEEDDINIVKVSPDGTRVVTVGMSAAVQLWDLYTGEVVGVPLKATYQYRTVIDADFSATPTRTGRQVWFYRVPHDLRTHGPYRTVRFSPTKPYIAVAAGRMDGYNITESYTRMYDLATGKLYDDFLTLDPPSTYFEFSPDGERSVHIGNFDDKRASKASYITIVDMVNLEQLIQIETAPIEIPTIRYSSDSTRVAIASRRREQPSALILLDGKTGEQVTMADVDEPPSHAVAFMPHSPQMVTIPRGTSTIELWDSRNGMKVWSVTSDCAYFHRVWVSADGQRIAAISNDQKIKVWDVNTLQELPSLLQGYVGVVGWQVVLTPDWNVLLNQRGLREVRIFDLGGQKEERRIDLWNGASNPPQRRTLVDTSSGDYIGDFKVTPDEKELVYTRRDGCAIFISLKSDLKLPKALQDEDPETFGGTITFNLDGSLIAISRGKCTQVWEYHSGKSLWKSTELDIENKFALSADGTTIAVYPSSTVQVFNLADNEEIGSIRARSLRHLDIQPGGNLLAITVIENFVMPDHQFLELWDWRSRGQKPMAQIKMPHESWNPWDRPRFSSDGKFVVIKSLVWAIDGNALIRVISDTIPPSLRDYPSFLTHRKGWIHAAFPYGPVLPLPPNFKAILDDKFRMKDVIARKNVIVLVDDYDMPTWIDLSAFVGSFD